MGKAEAAFEEARRRIAMANREGEERLDLSLEGLERIPGAVKELAVLKTINLARTKVADLSDISGLTELTSLYVASTPVKDISAISGLKQLRELRLSGTQVIDLGPISMLFKLNVLSISQTAVSDLSAIAGLTGLAELDLSETLVNADAFCHLAGMLRLHTGPWPARVLWSDQGLRFVDCSATRVDGRLKQISQLIPPAERARALFEYLGMPVPWQETPQPDPPAIPEQSTNGLRYRVGPTGVVGYDPRTTTGLLTDQQRQLHGFLLEDAGQLVALFGGGHNQPFAYVSQKLERYGGGLGATLDAVNPAVVWKVGNDLRLVLAADGARRPGDMTNRPAFDVDQKAGLQGLLSTHNALVSLHPDLAALDAVAVDPAHKHIAERDRALLQAAIEAFAAQTRLILAEVTQDLRDLHDEAMGETRAAIRAQRIEAESLENLIKAVVTQAIIEARGPSFLARVKGDVRGAVVEMGVVAGGVALGPQLAATYPQLVMALQPHISALLAAWHGKDYPVSDAVNWVMAKVRQERK
jgi:hypothetical protein